MPISGRLWMLAALVLCAASQSLVVVIGSPTPAIQSVSPPSDPSPGAARELQSPKQAPPKQSLAANSEGHIASAVGAGETNGINVKSAHVAQQQKINIADKLKRGLTNFINNYNPAPFFVPQLPGSAAKQPVAKSTSSTPTIINDGPSADAVIKGPNRLVQARTLGGPLRWGR